MSPFSEHDYSHWLEHGYVVAPLLDEAQLAAVVENVYEYMPSWEDYSRHPRRYQEIVGQGVRVDFPFVGDALNWTTIHPDLVAFAERVLRTERILLGHGQVGGKYAGTRDFDQPLHLDYGNNMLVVPEADDRAFHVPALLYYTDVTIELGPTCVVPQDFTREDPLVPRHRSREEYPQLYEHEVAVTVPAGHVLVYSMRTFHRGSRMTAREGLRFAQNIGFKRADVAACGQETFQHDGGRPEMDRFLERAAPRERELVGFPAVGDPYWTPEMVRAVGRRYPAMDMGPYEAGGAGDADASSPLGLDGHRSAPTDLAPAELSSLPGTPGWRKRL
jgi:ectoine hydroxylase-related dioxygenase (phytanoyl-CoA dioxygenase family)